MQFRQAAYRDGLRLQFYRTTEPSQLSSRKPNQEFNSRLLRIFLAWMNFFCLESSYSVPLPICAYRKPLSTLIADFYIGEFFGAET